MELENSMQIAMSGMTAQSARMRVISENVANADSLGLTPDDDPYRRKTIDFKSVLDRETGARVVKVARVGTDDSQFELRFDPTHPSANADGYVRTPNVQPLVEIADLREAQRTYEANLNMVDAAKQMLSKTIDLLR